MTENKSKWTLEDIETVIMLFIIVLSIVAMFVYLSVLSVGWIGTIHVVVLFLAVACLLRSFIYGV